MIYPTVSAQTQAVNDIVHRLKRANLWSINSRYRNVRSSYPDELNVSVDFLWCKLIYKMTKAAWYHRIPMYGADFDGFAPRAAAGTLSRSLIHSDR